MCIFSVPNYFCWWDFKTVLMPAWVILFWRVGFRDRSLLSSKRIMIPVLKVPSQVQFHRLLQSNAYDNVILVLFFAWLYAREYCGTIIWNWNLEFLMLRCMIQLCCFMLMCGDEKATWLELYVCVVYSARRHICLARYMPLPARLSVCHTGGSGQNGWS